MAAYQYGFGFTLHDPAPYNMVLFGHIRKYFLFWRGVITLPLSMICCMPVINAGFSLSDQGELLTFMEDMTVQFVGGARLLEATADIPYHVGLLVFAISVNSRHHFWLFSQQRTQ
ncbi:sodium:solute symporter family transporter [Candidatus Williamhamiltonella defendens]|uniref:sodium:solute symporter family transporter n=1 Tax=Candidatus Williamhamiltonella defendens TaxID=138072 RepID=UPI001F205ACC|nr:hypothetical protein [Candidatus Hamiltonella defensa]